MGLAVLPPCEGKEEQRNVGRSGQSCLIFGSSVCFSHHALLNVITEGPY